MDNFLDKTTMYRLVIYCLLALSAITLIGSLFGMVAYSPISLIFTLLFLLIISWATNNLFLSVFKIHSNLESVYVTALILFLIIPPADNPQDFILLGWAAVLAEASKYIIAISKKHIFNPAAIAVVLTGILLGQPITWWVGTMFMNPFILVSGLLIVWKIRRIELVLSFIAAATLTGLGFGIFNRSDLLQLSKQILLESPLLFFAFVMLTEPLTTPPTRKLQVYYGTLVGFLFSPQLHIFSLYSTPELALVLGNIFSYFVSPKGKLILPLKEKIQVAPDIFDFTFTLDRKIDFQPGQYMEWTIKHPNPDARGSRRYFTIASSPTEEDITIGVRFYEKSSSYKKAMLALQPGTEIMAGGLAGDFVLPKDPNIKLCFIAGGIGITPYRSMIKYLMDTKQIRSIILLYACITPQEVVYEEIFDEARRVYGLRTVYFVDDVNNFPNWQGRVGHVDQSIIMAEVPDYLERSFYISGPPAMVSAFKGVLTKMGVQTNKIKTDYFPGFA
ncbi:MAG: oxidoreductase [Microgenomates group bacterium]